MPTSQRTEPDTPLEELSLGVRAYNCLKLAGLSTLGDIAALDIDDLRDTAHLGTRRVDDFRDRAQLGTKLVNEIVDILHTAGHSLRDSSGHSLGDSSAAAAGVRRPRPSLALIHLDLPETVLTKLARAGLDRVGDIAEVRVGDLEDIPDISVGELADLRQAIAAALDLHGRGSAVSTPSDRRYRTGWRHLADAAHMAQLRVDGHTLEEIAGRFDVRKERIRQILKRERLTAAQVEAARMTRRRHEAALHGPRVVEMFAEGAEMPAIAAEVGIGVKEVTEIIRNTAGAADRAARRRIRSVDNRSPTYSDADILTAIRRASEDIGDVPTAAQYAQLARALALPSLPTIHNRFDGWAAAVRAAGMTPHASRRSHYTRRWSADACWNVMRRLVAELGEVPTFAQYELLSAANDDLPSGGTIRKRLGRWTDIVTRLHSGQSHPLLARIGVPADISADDRQEAIWLAYLANEIGDTELGRLNDEGLFTWQDTYGEPPTALERQDGSP